MLVALYIASLQFEIRGGGGNNCVLVIIYWFYVCIFITKLFWTIFNMYMVTVTTSKCKYGLCCQALT